MPTAMLNLPFTDVDVHREMYEWARHLFPVHRSLMGNGVRETLAYLRSIVPDFEIHEVPTGTKCFDWEVPDEWNVNDAYLLDPDGRRFADFRVNNLHLLGYSIAVNRELALEELQPHLYSADDQPDLIPYVTSYYNRRWGFCLSHRERTALKPGRYRAIVDASLGPGALSYADFVLPGQTSEEILLTSYICHPAMANNELSGPVVLVALARWLKSLPRRRYTYRFVLAPETLGSIVYISRHLATLKQNVRAGYVVTCVGDDRTYSFLPSRSGTTLADRAARHVLNHHWPTFKEYDFLERGSDERQYCFPTVDLPVASVMRSKYGEYPEYHTSADDLNLISPAGLGGGFEVYRKIVTVIEGNLRFKVTTICEPRLGIRNLYPDVSRKEIYPSVAPMINFLAFADGEHDLISLADRIGIYAAECSGIARKLCDAGLLSVVDDDAA